MSYSGGGSSSASIASASDVALSNPTDTQALTYNAATGKWKNHTLVPADIAGLESYVNALIAAAQSSN